MKTKVVMFTWNRKWTMRPIKVGNSTIELSKSARFLGVTLDNKLNFNEHITNITKKATACNAEDLQMDLHSDHPPYPILQCHHLDKSHPQQNKRNQTRTRSSHGP